MVDKINEYTLETQISNYPNDYLIPFKDYSWANNFGMRRLFKGEKYYWAKRRFFLGKEFDECIVAAINEVIYKIHFMKYEKDKQKISNLFEQISGFIDSNMNSEPEKYETESELVLLWKSGKGNAIAGLTYGYAYISITSSIIRNAKKRSFIDNILDR